MLISRILTIILILLYYSVSADNYNFNNVTVEDGLHHSTIREICQDKFGFMWIATEYGLNRLDPKTGDFKHFIKESGLPDDMIMGLLFDNQHNL